MKLVPRTSSFFDSPIDDFSRMIDNFFANPEVSDRAIMTSTFKVDVEEKDDSYVVEAELPGIKKEELTLDIDDGLLSICVNQTEEKNEEDEKRNFIHKERRSSQMMRRMSFPDIDEDNLKATLNDGILTITLPKKPEIETKKIINIE